MNSRHTISQRFIRFGCIVQVIILICMPTCLASGCSHPSFTWKADMDSMDVVTGLIFERKYCDVCGEYTDSRLKSFPLHLGNRFLFTPNEFEKRFESASRVFAKDYGGNEVMPVFTPLDNGELCLALCDDGCDLIGYIQFTDESQYLNETEQDEALISCVMVVLATEDASDWIDVMIPAFITCDGSLEVSDALDLCKSIVQSSVAGKPHKKNDIGYAFAAVGDARLFTISLLAE